MVGQPAKGRWRADRRRQPLGSKLRGRVSKGEQKCSGEETTGAVEVAGGHAISGTTKKLPAWEGKILGGDKDGKGKTPEEKKKREGRIRKRAAALWGQSNRP
ncbi:hypothetical protein LINPERPRIM_LOCUS6576 [Linum perenne]